MPYTPDTWPYVLASPAYHLKVAGRMRRMARVMRDQGSDPSVVLFKARLHVGLARRARIEGHGFDAFHANKEDAA